MRVLILSTVPSPYQRDLFEAFSQEQEIELTVCYLEEEAPDSPWPKKSPALWEKFLPGICLGRGRVRSHWNWGLPDFRAFDVVLLNMALTDMTMQWSAWRAKKQRVPYFFWGEILRSSTRPLLGFVQKCFTRCLHSVHGIIGIGEEALADYRVRLPELENKEGARFFSLPYSCDLTAFEKITPPLSEEPVRFLFCGQMIQRKGIDVLLNAFHQLITEGIHAELLLIGREAELPGLLKELPQKTREKITYFGFQAPEALPEYFKKASVFVLPSRHDGWGVVINQALSAGLPIISTTATGAARELVADGKTGILVTPSDITALHTAMRRMAKDLDLRKKMHHATKDATDKINPQKNATRLRRFLEESLHSWCFL